METGKIAAKGGRDCPLGRSYGAFAAGRRLRRKIDIRKAGGNYDPETYYIRVAADRAEEAKALLSRELGRVLL